MLGLTRLSLTQLNLYSARFPACLASLTSLQHLEVFNWPVQAGAQAVMEEALTSLQGLTCLGGCGACIPACVRGQAGFGAVHACCWGRIICY